jgi:formylglycine-generating enzyme required for sulfatase activity
MAGNVYEWCIPDPGRTQKGLAAGRGGSWAERDPKMQTVYARAFFDRGYRDVDMGFRVVLADE